ncbi:MAG: hypothetical protein E7258_05290 [Lachnospiraceae bacterium]|nr:hypothetical protein [Lachnospiraceae bacterium]
MSLTYYSPVSDGDITYSCDMLRIKFYINALKTQSFLDWFSRADLKYGFYYDYYRSTKIGSYKLLFACSYTNYDVYGRESTFTLGFGLNEASRVYGANCMIEFNPNKNDMKFMRKLLEYIAMFVDMIEGKVFHLMRYDLAVDIPVRRENVLLLKQGKREYHRIIGSSLTEYVGKRNSNGFVKVYDKAVESSLDTDLTRIEITCDSLDTYPLPSVHILQDIEDDFSDLNSTDIVLVNLIRRLDYDEQQVQLKMLGRTKREKLQRFIFPKEREFKFNLNSIRWVTYWIDEILNCWNYDILIPHEVEKESIKDEDYKQCTIFD